jgi:hypothetical protein
MHKSSKKEGLDMNYTEHVGEISEAEFHLIAHARNWTHNSRRCALCQKHKEVLELKLWQGELITGERTLLS